MLNSITKKQIESYLLKYLEETLPNFKIKKGQLFQCPFHSSHQIKNDLPSCTITDNYNLICHDPNCGNIGNIFIITRKLQPEFMKCTDEEIADYLINLLDIRTDDEVEKLLSMYAEKGFALFPLRKGGQGNDSKKPVSGESWFKNISKDINQWREWTNAGLGLALAAGKASMVITIDVDSDKTELQLKDKFNPTMEQRTYRGKHRVYLYDNDFDNVTHTNVRDRGYDMEIRVNHAYIAIAPTSAEGEKREWNNSPISPLSIELKEFLLSLIEKKNDLSENLIQDAIDKEDFGIKNGLTGLDGQCNDVWIKLGGILRKKLSIDGVQWALYNFNKLLAKPLLNKDIKAMTYQIAKYSNYDKKDLAEAIYDRLIKTDTANVRELKESLKQESKDIEDALRYLIQENRVLKQGRSYKPIVKVEWQTDFMSVGKKLQYEVPFFEKYNNFEDGSMIILGASTGIGKSTCACNLIYEFVQKKVCPYYICTEAGSRFGIISAKLGLKENDFKFKILSDASTVELEDNVVTILDWLKPPNSDYAKFDTIMERLNEQLVKHGGLLIVFMQLRKAGEREGQFFAPDLIGFYASLIATYNYEVNTQGKKDNLNTFFRTEKMRASKGGTQYVTIPIQYDPETYRIKER